MSSAPRMMASQWSSLSRRRLVPASGGVAACWTISAPAHVSGIFQSGHHTRGLRYRASRPIIPLLAIFEVASHPLRLSIEPAQVQVPNFEVIKRMHTEEGDADLRAAVASRGP